MAPVYITYGQGVKAHELSIRRPGREYSTCDEALRTKPEINVYNRSPENIFQLCASIQKGNVVNIKDYVAVLSYLLKKFCRDFCSEEFKTCGLVVATAGSHMTPLNFLEEKIITVNVPEIDVIEPMTDIDDQKMLLVRMLAAHRVQAAEDVNDKDNAYSTKVSNQVKNACGRIGIKLEGVRLVHAERFSIAVDYMRLLSAADMFFTKFPTNEYACFKVGTLTMSYKDMSQMNNSLYLVSLTGQPWEVLVYYIFETSLARELDGIEPGQWWDEIYYFPYQSSMGLLGGKFTYYSNTRNPKSHNTIQLVGIMTCSPRSFNAYYLDSPTALQIGQAVFWIMASTGEGGYMKTVYDNTEDAEVFDKATVKHRGNLSPSDRASEFLQEIPVNAREYADAANRMLRAAKKFAEGMPTPRMKSFGKWIKDVDVETLTEALYERMVTTGRGARSERYESDNEDSD